MSTNSINHTLSPVVNNVQGSANETQQNSTNLADIPQELLQYIFSFLSSSDICSSLRINQHISKCFSGESSLSLWESLRQSHFPDLSHIKTEQPNGKDQYEYVKFISQNPVLKKFRLQIVSSPENINPRPRDISLYENSLFVGTNNGINLYDLESGKTQEYLSSTSELTKFVVKGNRLYASFWDRTLIVLDIINRKPLHTFKCDCVVSAIAVQDDLLYAGLKTGPIEIFDLTAKVKLDSLNGHSHCITCMAVLGDRLYSGSMDGTLKLWDLNTRKELDTLKNDFGILDMLLRGDTMYFASLDKTIKIWDLNTKKVLHTFGPGENYPAMGMINDYLFFSGTGSEDFKDGSFKPQIKVWEVKKKKEVQTYHMKTDTNECVKSLTVQDGRLIVGLYAAGPSIYIFDFNFPSYNVKILEENLSILEEMRKQKNPSIEAMPFIGKLHPDFQKPFSFSVTHEVILRVQTEVCLELLLDRIHSEDEVRISQLIDLLKLITTKPQIEFFMTIICDRQHDPDRHIVGISTENINSLLQTFQDARFIEQKKREQMVLEFQHYLNQRFPL